MSVIIGFVFNLRVLSIKRIVLTWKIKNKKKPDCLVFTHNNRIIAESLISTCCKCFSLTCFILPISKSQIRSQKCGCMLYDKSYSTSFASYRKNAL